MSTQKTVTILPPNLQTVALRIIGSAPYVQNKFSAKSRAILMAKHEAGSTAKKGTKREPKNFTNLFNEAHHISEEGWIGIPAPAFRSAMIDACRLVGFKMTHAKLSVFAVADGYDVDDGTPLVKIIAPPPERHDSYVRNETGVVDIRPRPMWRKWEADVRVQYDADQFTLEDVMNLMMRAGAQVGIGEGRPNSKKSHGIGWGTFTIATEAQSEEKSHVA